MENFNFDERLFLWLNFDGGAALDAIMSAISGAVMWIPLYLFIAWMILRKYGWKSLIAFIVCLALAMGISDMLCGIFKHTGLLQRELRPFQMGHGHKIRHAPSRAQRHQTSDGDAQGSPPTDSSTVPYA